MRNLRYALLGVLVLLALYAGPAPVAEAATLAVDSTSDGGDKDTTDGVCDAGTGVCTLRVAIEQANDSPGTDTIAFNKSGAGPTPSSPPPPCPVSPTR